MAKTDCRVEFEELRTVDAVSNEENAEGKDFRIVVGRLAEVRFVDENTGIVLSTQNVPYGSQLFVEDGEHVEKGTVIAKWDPFNAVIVTENAGTIQFENVTEGVSFRVEEDEATGLRERIVIESKDKSHVPTAHIIGDDGEVIRTYSFPINGHIVVEDGQKLNAGDVLVKIPRVVGKAGDITGGLPRVTELFEARNPSNPAVVSEIDGEITMGNVKRGHREIIVTSKLGEVKKYLVPLSKQILVQENDYVRAGTPLSDGSIPLAAIWNPAGRHMQSRRPPYGIPLAAICNPVGRQVPAGMNNRLSDDECWMLQYGDLHPHSSPNGREDLILSS